MAHIHSFTSMRARVLALLAIGLALSPLVRQQARAAEGTTPAEAVTATDPRLCATAAVYALGPGADRDSRARAALRVLAAAPTHRANCAPAVSGALSAGLDPALWLSSLRLVDALTSARPLNDTCARGASSPPCSGAPGAGVAFSGSAR